MALKGLTQVMSELRAATDDVVSAVAAGVYLEGNNIVGEAKDNTPVKHGTLRASLYCTRPKIDGGKVFVDIGGGGPAGKYIVRQHEGDYKHEHGTRKFLERAINNAAGAYVNSVGEIALQHIGQGALNGSAPTRPDNAKALEAAQRGDK